MSDEESVLFCSDIGETGRPPSFLIDTSSMCRGSAVRYVHDHTIRTEPPTEVCSVAKGAEANKLEQQSVMIDCDSNSTVAADGCGAWRI